MDMVKISLDRIRQFEPKGSTLFGLEKYQVGNSGGKDSAALVQLMRMSGVPFDEHYNVTTIDPPEIIYHLRKHHPKLIWNYPKMHLLTRMVVKECFPPTRTIRWCCKIYKERVVTGGMVVLGIRAAESVQRSKRRFVEKCSECPDLAGYYPYISGGPRLVSYYCEHKKLKGRTGAIARTRWGIYDKMKTKPRWCPRKGAK